MSRKKKSHQGKGRRKRKNPDNGILTVDRAISLPETSDNVLTSSLSELSPLESVQETRESGESEEESGSSEISEECEQQRRKGDLKIASQIGNGSEREKLDGLSDAGSKPGIGNLDSEGESPTLPSSPTLRSGVQDKTNTSGRGSVGQGNITGENACDIDSPEENGVLTKICEKVAHPEQGSFILDTCSDCATDTDSSIDLSDLAVDALHSTGSSRKKKVRSDSFLCGITPLNTPYTPASLIKFMRDTRTSWFASSQGDDVSAAVNGGQAEEEYRAMSGQRWERPISRSHQCVNNGNQGFDMRRRPFSRTLCRLASRTASRGRKLIDDCLSSFLPQKMIHSTLFTRAKPLLVSALLFFLVAVLFVIVLPVAVVLCLCTAPVWALAAAVYMGARLLKAMNIAPPPSPRSGREDRRVKKKESRQHVIGSRDSDERNCSPSWTSIGDISPLDTVKDVQIRELDVREGLGMSDFTQCARRKSSPAHSPPVEPVGAPLFVR